ncbi:MAG: 6-phosphogluconolactonase [Phycisphaerales bacterium]
MYEIDDTPLPTPPLPGQVVLATDADDAIERLGIDLVQHAENCVRRFGDFHVALSGGVHPRKLYRRLMYAPEFRWIPWRRTHLWFTSERCTGLDDAASTFRAINDFIGDHSDLPPEQFHPIFAASPTAAMDYERRLREHLGWRERGQDRLDYVLLTVDAAGATAGLPAGIDPGSLESDGRLVVRTNARGEVAQELSPPDAVDPAVTDGGHIGAVDGTGLANDDGEADAANGDASGHVTMLPSIINAARFVAVLAAGPEPADGLALAADGAPAAASASAPIPAPSPAIAAPIRAIRPVSGELTWYVDPPACRQILSPEELAMLAPEPSMSTFDRLGESKNERRLPPLGGDATDAANAT